MGCRCGRRRLLILPKRCLELQGLFAVQVAFDVSLALLQPTAMRATRPAVRAVESFFMMSPQLFRCPPPVCLKLIPQSLFICFWFSCVFDEIFQDAKETADFFPFSVDEISDCSEVLTSFSCLYLSCDSVEGCLQSPRCCERFVGGVNACVFVKSVVDPFDEVRNLCFCLFNTVVAFLFD